MFRLIYSISVIFILVSCGYKQQNILTLGDSHGAHKYGWVNQLKQLVPEDSILNYSISGNTIGYNNLNRDTLNTLRNIHHYLMNANNTLKHIDKIILVLGTNDCKAIFDSTLSNAVNNLDTLISEINNYPFGYAKPEVFLCTPPPAGNDSILIAKYFGIGERLKFLYPQFKQISAKYNCKFIDVYTPLIPGFDTLNEDGIHLNEHGYKIMAAIIKKNIE